METDIRLKTLPYKFRGKEYILRCNFNVLADLQEQFGEIPDLLSGEKSMKAFLAFLAAMMNDYADEMGWPERFTGREIGREIHGIDRDLMQGVLRIAMSGLYIESDEDPDGQSHEGDQGKN